VAGAAVVGAGAAASHLLSGSGADVALAAAAGFKIKGNNDLEIVEGIGPKIAGLFHDSGTHTFAQLASLSLAEMHKVLENGGSRFKLANPGTWAQQARLCHENRWVELQKLQDALDGGVDNSDSHNA
jgi:predicted flap endonuclease-1-like 5' DNA nuclease